MSIHMSAKHKTEKQDSSFQCSICDQELPTGAQLQAHMKVYHGK